MGRAVLLGVMMCTAQLARADVHSFHTLDRHGRASELSLDLSVVRIADATAFGSDLWAQYVHGSGVGAYLAFPATTVALDGPNQAALGNAEGGALFGRSIGSDLELVAHGGVAYDYEHQGIAPKQYIGAFARVGELVQRWGFTTWLRVAISVLGRRDRFFWRADLGLDLMLDDHEGMGLAIGPVARAGVGAGVVQGRNQLTLELAAVHIDETPELDRFSATIAIGAKRSLGRWQPGVALVVPLSQLAVAAIASIGVAP